MLLLVVKDLLWQTFELLLLVVKDVLGRTFELFTVGLVTTDWICCLLGIIDGCDCYWCYQQKQEITLRCPARFLK